MNRVIALVFGLVLAHIPVGLAMGELIVNGSFEIPEGTLGRPTTFGDWGDNLSSIVTAENGITPAHGIRMLKFIGTTRFGPGGPGTRGSSIYQTIDMRPYSTLVASGRVRVGASAKFNRILGTNQTDSEFSFGITAHSGNVANFPDDVDSPIAGVGDILISDGDPVSWEVVNVNLNLPTNSSYIAIHISAVENIFDEPGDGLEFHGHYVDLASASISLKSGDFNRDNAVDAADYPLWRTQIGELVPACSGPDANCNGAVDNNDYQIWRSNFGKTLGSATSIATSALVPEPASGGLCGVLAVMLVAMPRLRELSRRRGAK